MPLPFPQRIFSRVTDITPALLARLGVRGILLDIDGTIAPTHTPLPPQEVRDWLDTLKQAGILVYILSNNRHEARVRTLAQALDLPWQWHAGKPKKAGFDRAFSDTGLRPEELAVVGDQIYTDMWGARRNGCRALMVESLDTALWYFPLRRLAELPFRREKP